MSEQKKGGQQAHTHFQARRRKLRTSVSSATTLFNSSSQISAKCHEIEGDTFKSFELQNEFDATVSAKV
jgi:hypothetical protein